MQIFHSSLLFLCMFFNRWCFLAAYSLLCRLPLRDTSICYGYQYMYEFRRLSFDLCFNMIRFFLHSTAHREFYAPFCVCTFKYNHVEIPFYSLFRCFLLLIVITMPFFYAQRSRGLNETRTFSCNFHFIDLLSLSFFLSLALDCCVCKVNFIEYMGST